MKRPFFRLALTALCAAPPVAAVALAPDQVARALLGLPLPTPALAVAQSPVLRGEALYRLGRWREAAEIYGALGAAQAYNHANALAQSGEFAAAIAAYDQALAAEPGEEDASFNRALAVEALYRQRLAVAGAGAAAANAAASLRAKGQLDRMTPNDKPSGTGDGWRRGRNRPHSPALKGQAVPPGKARAGSRRIRATAMRMARRAILAGLAAKAAARTASMKPFAVTNAKSPAA